MVVHLLAFGVAGGLFACMPRERVHFDPRAPVWTYDPRQATCPACRRVALDAGYAVEAN